MKIQSLSLLLSTLTAFANATIFGFNVVSLTGQQNTKLGVKYNNNEVAVLNPTVYPLYSGGVNANKIDKYKYVIVDDTGKVIEEENIERTYSEENSKINEVFNRTTKSVTIPPLPKALKSLYPMGSKKFTPFPNNEIFNIYANCNEVYEDIKNQPFKDGVRNDAISNCTISIITPTETFQSTGVIRPIGFGSRLYKKLSWIIKLDKKFMGRKAIKVRAMATDPTLMREKFNTDLYAAVGVPVQEGTYARVIINQDVWGLYYAMDSLSKNWFSAYLHGGDKAKVGTDYKLISTHPTGPYADLKYQGDDVAAYTSDVYQVDEISTQDTEAIQKDPQGKYRLVQFTKLFDEWNGKYQNDNSEAAVDALKQFLDVETTLRIMAVETLTLAEDNFWLVMSNVALYYNLEKNNYVFIPFDFDETLKGIQGDYFKENYLDDCLTWATDIPNFDHYFTNSLMRHPLIVERFKIILAKTVRDTFNHDSASSHIDGLVNLIHEDVEWNFGLIDKLQSSYTEGQVNHFTLKNFEDNVNNSPVPYDKEINVNDAPYGLKEYITLRGDKCGTFTKDVVIPASDLVVDDEPNSTISSYKVTLFLILSQFILFLFF
ncbi:hypothetical protein BCR32DRAFT_241488 [Anaeromyces robustus]|jgi:3D (Asp-Asp-Asp) domain-containing protein|uniref:Coth-domain-containing protein n=1 Tax=Anaeromyces robustus TaxID=1754192 RepID=A0A1Y1XJI4_9FUNG|nr:hypothetical protein BCR32DRAFT_241488 [Anaeromyces robustus]|eukprot:ORX85863.1 hypothetical protein BCR32DRAFT_241488 [Anaeromyces robustus]